MPKVPCPPPAGATTSVVPPGVPTIQEKTDGEVEDPVAKTVVVVNTGSIDLGDDYHWQGAEEGLDYIFGHEDDDPAASDATIVNTAPVNLNASISSYAATCPTVARS